MSDFETHRKSTQTLSDFGGPGLFQTAHFRLNVNAGLHAGQSAPALVCFGNGGAYGRSSADSATRKAPGIFHHCLEHSGRPGGGSRRSVCRQISLVGFGIDSFIEVTSGVAVLWRMSVDDEIHRRERNESPFR